MPLDEFASIIFKIEYLSKLVLQLVEEAEDQEKQRVLEKRKERIDACCETLGVTLLYYDDDPYSFSTNRSHAGTNRRDESNDGTGQIR